MASSSRSTVFRVTGLPIGKAVEETQSALTDTVQNLLTEDERQRLKVNIACIPACDRSQTSCALVDFKGGNPSFLSQLDHDQLGGWQVEMGDEDINFDRHFFGFTQLYPTAAGQPITADIIAITGLDGHAYGSWRGKGNLGRMWLRDFLSKDLPNCRTMIYGYNSKLSSHGIDTIMDYGREFLEGIKRVRPTKELRERPLFFIAHSFGGIVLAHSLVKAVQTDERDHATIAALHKATYGILFFGTPHKGLVIDDIQRMMAGEEQHLRQGLLEQIQVKSDLLIYQLVDFKNLIRDRKIVSFYETQQTRRLEMNTETRLWGRTGPYITAVESDSALLQLPDSIETKIPVHADHSQIVKFDSRNDDTYQAAVGYLKQFDQDAKKIVSDRFLPARRKAPLSTVPFDRDAKFVGRQDVLQALESQFSQGHSHKRAVLVGLGGVGKSQIAIEWSYRVRDKDPNTWVFWVHASTAERFLLAYKSIAAVLELPGWDNPKTDVLGLVSRWLSDIDNGRWFMILDNADDVEVFCSTPDRDLDHRPLPLSSYIPQTMTGSVLLTTRDRKAVTWLSTGYESQITVKLMTRQDAEQLLRTKIPEGLSSDLEITGLVKELDYLPLAITQAAAYISARATRMTVSTYLTLYRSDDVSQSRLLDEESGDLRRDPGVPNSVIQTWQISFDQIKRKWPTAAELLSLIAMLDRQGIPKFLLSKTYPSPLDFDKALTPLDEFSLVTIEKSGKTYEIHRLVQLATRKWLERYQEIERWQGIAVETVSRAFPNGDYSNWKTCETLWPHTQEVLKSKLVSDTICHAQAVLLYNMAWYSLKQGHYNLAKIQSQESLSTFERLPETDDIKIFNSANLLGQVLHAQGKYEEAETMNRRALAGLESALGLEHPDTLASVSNLASVLGDQGKYEEAETMNRRALTGRERALGLEHPDTLASVNNFASVLQYQGKYEEAETMNRRALTGRETALGLEHPDTLASVNDLALVLQYQGKYEEAETMNRQALTGYEMVLGLEHPDTLTSVNNLASVLQHQGKYEEAETMNRQALAGLETALGLEHPHTLKIVYNIAYLLKAREKYEDAAVLYQRASLGLQKQLGSDHPITRACLGHYKAMLEEQERRTTAN